MGNKKLNKEDSSVLSGVVALSRMMTRSRHLLSGRYLSDPLLRKAYCEYFLLANEQKVHLPLTELLLHPRALAGRDTLAVLDVGTGPGTSLLGVHGFFAARARQPRLAFTAVDRVGENLAEAVRLLRERGPGTALRTLNAPLEEIPSRLKERYDLIIFSNVLNELYAAEDDRAIRRAAPVRDILRTLLAEDGSAVIIEPALRETSRDLLLVRDALFQEGITVYSPCLLRDRCPALINPKDWCHEDVPWDPPALVREIDRCAGLRKDSLKFSYLVLRKDRLALADILPESSFRVVSEPLVSRGKTELFLCGPGGRKTIVRFDKDRREENGNFETLRRGMAVSFTGLLDEGKRWRVGKETQVVIALPRERGREGASGTP